MRDNRREAKIHDKYSVGVYVKRKGRHVLVQHVPAEISQLMANFLNHRGRFTQKNAHTDMQTDTHTHTHTLTHT